MIRWIDKLAGGLSAALLAVAAVALFALVPMAGWLVYGRYILNASPTWVEATSLVLMLVVTFFVAAVATRSDEHLAIHFVRDAMPGPIRKTMRALSDLIMMGFGLFMADASLTNAIRTWSRDIPLLNIPEGMRHVPLVVGGVGIALFSAIHLAMLFSRRPPPDAEPGAVIRPADEPGG